LVSGGAALLAGLLVYGVYLLQLRQVELQQTVNIVVPKAFIKSGTLITAEMIEMRPVLKGAYNGQMLTQASEAIGQETLVPLGRHEPLLSWKIDKFHLLPGYGQATFQIPKDYILSIPGGIRAGDRIIVYLSGKGGAARLIPNEIVVASVKSAANVEVDDVKEPNLISMIDGDRERMYASRRDANGVIDQISLNMTEEEWLTIDRACHDKQGQLVIAFRTISIIDEQELNKVDP
jgi:hypothetical protein